MKVKSITIETDKGDEVTMSMDDAEKFFKAMRRIKLAAAPPKPDPEPAAEDVPSIATHLEIMKMQHEMEMARQRQGMMPNTQSPKTWTTSASSGSGSIKFTDTYSLIGN